MTRRSLSNLPGRLRRKLARLAASYQDGALRRPLKKMGLYQRKLFCVGLNKTGTTSMEAVMRLYGFRVAPQAQAEALYWDGGLTHTPAFWEWADRWEGFQDVPFSMTDFIAPIYERYPDARYVLTVRDPELWFRSLKNHHFTLMGLPPDASPPQIAAALKAVRYSVPGFLDRNVRKRFQITSDEQLYNAAHCIPFLLEHNAVVRQVIPADRLLEIDLSAEDTTARICDFLELPKSYVRATPHRNQRL